MHVKNFLICLMGFSVCLSVATADDIQKAVSGTVFCEVPILSVDKVETVSEVIGDSPLSSKVTIKITGTYETAGNPNKDSVLATTYERISSGGFPINTLMLKLHVVSSDASNKNVGCFGNISSPKKFEAELSFKPSGWSGGSNTYFSGQQLAETWAISFGPRAVKRNEKGYTLNPFVSAHLSYSDKVKKWSVTSMIDFPGK